jgi:hypothetical protein
MIFLLSLSLSLLLSLFIMGNFSIMLDNKFDELINKNEKISLEDLIELKAYLKIAYYNDNLEDNKFIKFSLSEIDFKI